MTSGTYAVKCRGLIKRYGEEAAQEVGVHGLNPKLIHLLGRLRYRTSYSQNVLRHSIEVAFVAGMIAEEIGANVRVAKTATLLHDVGKAVTHKIEGKHHHIGGEIARKYGLPEEVAHAIFSPPGQQPGRAELPCQPLQDGPPAVCAPGGALHTPAQRGVRARARARR